MIGEGTYIHERNKYVRMFLSVIYYDRDKFNLAYVDSRMPLNALPLHVIQSVSETYFCISLNSLWFDIVIRDFPDLFSKELVTGITCLTINLDHLDVFEL